MQNEDLKTISWQENRPLTWSDFEAIPTNTSSAAALTASGITFGFSIDKEDGRVVDFDTTIDCFFYPEKSWVKPEYADDYILRHEQLHFNITELHARKFRKQIKQLRVSSKIRNQLNRLYKDINQTSYDMQKRYDEETNHSINKEKQKEWDNFITQELEKLSGFKST